MFHSMPSPHLAPHLLRLGLYYSWASPRHGWVDSEIPQCIHQARKLISKLVSNYRDTDPGDEIIPDEMVWEELPVDPRPSTSSNDAEGQDTRVTGNVRIDQIVALAWTASGSRRVRQFNDTPSTTYSRLLRLLICAVLSGYCHIREEWARVHALPWC